MGGGARYRVTALAAVLASAGAASHAQVAESDGGVRAVVGLDTRLEYDDGSSAFSTGLDFALISATRTSQLSFSSDTDFVVPLDNTDDAEFREPGYGIDYLRDNSRSRFTLGANFKRRDLDGSFIVDPDASFDEEELSFINGGTEERTRISTGLEVGRTDRIGAEFQYSYDERIYSGEADPDLEDETRDAASVSLRFDVSRSLRLGLSSQWTLTEEDGALGERDERLSYGIDATWQARPTLALIGDVSYEQIDTETPSTLGPTEFTEQEGVNLRFGATLDRPNGTYQLDLSRSLTSLGYETRAEMTRRLTLPRDAQLTLSLGAIELPGGNTYGIGALRYARDTSRGSLSASLSQDATVNNDDEEVRRQIIEGTYAIDLSGEAQIGLSGRLTNSEFVEGTSGDISSARVSVDYRRPLTADWNFGAGASREVTSEDGEDDVTNDQVFLTISRSFTFRR